MKIQLSLDKTKFQSKPSTEKQFKNLTDRRGKPITEVRYLGSNVGTTIKNLTLEQFSTYIRNGQTWSPYLFEECPITKKRRRRADLFLSCQLLALDFDSGIEEKEILKRCEDNQLSPNLIYETFSSSPALRKYRVIFVLDKVYTESSPVRYMILTLLDIFPEADQAVKDLARLYFGTGQNKYLKIYDAYHGHAIEITPKVQEQYDFKSYESLSELELSTDEKNLSNSFQFCSDEEFLKHWVKLSQDQRAFIISTVATEFNRIQAFTLQEEQVSGKSRYEILFRAAERLTGIKGLTGNIIFTYLNNAVKLNPYYADWRYTPEEVIMAAIKWKAQTPNIKAGLLYCVDGKMIQ